MSKYPSILNRTLWDDPTLNWLEDHLQIAITEEFGKLERVLPFTFAADMNGLRTSKRSAARAKAAGMRSGEPDLRIYLNDGRIGFIELKRKNGVTSKKQKDRHKQLRDLGHDVRVLKAACPREAVDKAVKILDEWIC